MRKFEFKKKLVIGSANFEKKYGLSRIKLDKKEINKIFKLAKSNNLYTIDTADGYLKNKDVFKDIDKSFKFITKVKPNQNWVSLEYCKKKIRSHFKILKINKVQTLLIHDIKILYSNAGPSIYENLLTLKKKNFFKKIGVSIYSMECLNFLTTKYDIDVVQCPYNVLDKRLIKSGWYKKLKEKKIEIHVRSLFLQGLLLNKQLYKNKYFKKWQNIFSKWFQELDKKNISAIQYCFNDVLKYNFDKIIIGINNQDNLKEILNLKLAKMKYKLNDFTTNDLKLIDPRKWKN